MNVVAKAELSLLTQCFLIGNKFRREDKIMKKFLLPVLLASFLVVNTASANTFTPNNSKCSNCHKKMSERKSVNKGKKGLKHGYYDLTHNKVTRATKINSGNVRYKNQTDIK
jgi:hypothetical protein